MTSQYVHPPARQLGAVVRVLRDVGVMDRLLGHRSHPQDQVGGEGEHESTAERRRGQRAGVRGQGRDQGPPVTFALSFFLD